MGFGKSTLYSILPPGTRYRELWLPELINNHATLPSSIAGGHPLTVTGARKGTTADGVHFITGANSNINCGAIHNAAAKLWVSFRFKLDEDHTTASATQVLLAKRINANEYFMIHLLTGNGFLNMILKTAATQRFSISIAHSGLWNANTWYHVMGSIGQQIAGGAASDGARLKADDADLQTNADMNALPNGGNFVIGERVVGDGMGPTGTIADVFVGTDDLTAVEETDLYKGIVPIDVREVYTLDEGRGTTAYNRGLAGAGSNGTLDTSCTWKFGQVQQPVLSFDNIDDYAISAAAVVDIAGDITVVWVAKMKSTYQSISRLPDFTHFIIHTGNDNRVMLQTSRSFSAFVWFCDGGTAVRYDYTLHPVIDDYWIIIGTYTISGNLALYHDGFLVGTDTGGDSLPGGLTRACLGAYTLPDRYDCSKPLFVALIDGAFTEKQARTFSKELNGILGLGLTI